MKKRAERIKEFLTSLDSKAFVRFTRPFEAGSTMGFVLGRGPKFFLLALVSDVIRFDGFLCLRYQDVRNLRVREEDAKFPLDALWARGLRIPRKPPVDLSSIGLLLETAGRRFPVVTIHQEKINPDVCRIGRVIKAGKEMVSLLEIGPDAVWDEEPTDHNLSKITQVAFGGGYEDALVLVGGVGPKVSKAQRKRK